MSGGLHGVGISVVNALSEWMITEVKRDGFLWQMKFERGITVQKLKKIGKAPGTGTRQWFKPDPEVFEVSEFHWDILQKRLRELAFLNRGLAITLRDERPVRSGEPVRERTYEFDGGSYRSSNGLRKKRCAPPHYFDSLRARQRRRRGGDAVHGHLRRPDLFLREQHRNDRRRHAPPGLSAGRYQRGERLRAQARHAQGIGQLAFDRRHRRRPYRSFP